MVKFIAEVSSNHAQDLGRSLAFVDAAADCGFDAVKFQLFRVAQLFAPEILAKSPQHRKRVAWELPLEHLEPLARRCREKGGDHIGLDERRTDAIDADIFVRVVEGHGFGQHGETALRGAICGARFHC